MKMVGSPSDFSRRDCEQISAVCREQRKTNEQRITDLEKIMTERAVKLMEFDYKLRDIKILVLLCILVSAPQLAVSLPKLIAMLH